MRATAAVVVLVALVGCADPVADPVAYRVVVHRQDMVYGRPPPAVAATVYIDGVPTSFIERTFESNEAYLAAEVHVELRHDDRVLDTFVAGRHSCPDGGTLESVSENIAQFDHGELTSWSYSIDGACPVVGDDWEWPRCPSACATGTHCTSVMTSLDPPFSRVACAPVGSGLVGNACSWQLAIDGYVHDCGADLLCAGGTCRVVCTDGVCQGCSFVEGHASLFRVCP